ncbi:MAG: hypothetical protein AB7I98_03785 [Verrucomicrobiales bacterium]
MKEGDNSRKNMVEKDSAGRWLAPGYPQFRYSDNEGLTAIHRINLGRSEVGETYLEVVGGLGGGYEFGIRRGGEITAHSDCGYGCAHTALRDGLLFWEGLPDEPIEVKHPETGQTSVVAAAA